MIGDKGYAGREFETAAGLLDATIIRPGRKDEPSERLQPAPIRQRTESIFRSCKDLLTLERRPLVPSAASADAAKRKVSRSAGSVIGQVTPEEEVIST